MSVITLVLAHVPLFSGLAPDELETLGRSLRPRRYARGDLIFQQGDPGDTLYVIESGEVKVVLTSADGREAILTILGPGHFFGELSLLDSEPRSADVIAKEDCALLALRRDDFQAFLNAHPHAAITLLAVLSRRLRATDDLLHDAAFLDVASRLARLLLKLAETHGRKEERGLVLGIRLTQEDLASMVSSTRETVNKWLKTWQRQGLLEQRGGILTITQPRELRKRTHLIGEIGVEAEAS
ncbi:MAG TPA: Crp/Fnr family transcriptional regulator [Chloroflexota bacterium]|nr:Crp/Fnr family transcriptional regulator [Chloroflexota bacterium]